MFLRPKFLTFGWLPRLGPSQVHQRQVGVSTERLTDDAGSKSQEGRDCAGERDLLAREPELFTLQSSWLWSLAANEVSYKSQSAAGNKLDIVLKA